MIPNNLPLNPGICKLEEDEVNVVSERRSLVVWEKSGGTVALMTSKKVCFRSDGQTLFISLLFFTELGTILNEERHDNEPN